MEDEEHRRLSNEFKRIRHLRTNNPFCRICGKDGLWARYDNHHPDLRANSSDTIFTCEDCHRELHAMLNEFPRIPSNVPKSRHRLIHMARGQIAIARLSQKKWGEIEQWLLNVVDLPPATEAVNDNGEDEEADERFERPDVIADLEARFGDQNKGSSK
jgi:hypothetical protein